MEQLISMLLHAQKVSQVLHWGTKSFAKHIALGELYEALATKTDELTEIWMGKYGNSSQISTGSWSLSETEPTLFVAQLAALLEQMKAQIPQDDFIVNKYEELEADVSRAKYKIENLA